MGHVGHFEHIGDFGHISDLGHIGDFGHIGHLDKEVIFDIIDISVIFKISVIWTYQSFLTYRIIGQFEHIGNFGPSGVHALPLAAGINIGGHYFRYFWSERSACAALGCWHKRRWPLFLVRAECVRQRSALRWPLF